ncbi:phosphoadenylyl-sulfate reductase [Mesobacterium pallidum]|uniref:phosphoadenylyl-sulfate reductase n=1 Tax=Mesobacterium pallidum TaxID=2872037 RepID=UPI001EE1E728|nr:phosphoadenylyl-sulfate reductase [Mesobacterium pallidum]
MTAQPAPQIQPDPRAEEHARQAARVAELNARFRHHGATSVLKVALRDKAFGEIAMVSSFGAESVALLHLVSTVDPGTPVLFIDTELLFPETLEYQQTVAERLELTDVRTIKADPARLAERDPYGALKFSDQDLCCTLRKTEPLDNALADFAGWITGRKRFQGGKRAQMEFFELDPDGRIKVNPLAHWRPGDVAEYMAQNNLPRHPLVAQGYPSIGCAPCTSKVAEGEDPRAGRWRGRDKTECGIHLVDGRMIREGDAR